MAYRAKPDSEPDWDDEARGRTPTSTNPKAAPAQPKRAVTPGEVRKRAVAYHASAPRPVFGIALFASAMLVVVISIGGYREPIAKFFLGLSKSYSSTSVVRARSRDADQLSNRVSEVLNGTGQNWAWASLTVQEGACEILAEKFQSELTHPITAQEIWIAIDACANDNPVFLRLKLWSVAAAATVLLDRSK